MQGEVFAPGRVNLIGEHIDYHGLPVLPMAIRRGIRLRWKVRDDRRIVAESTAAGAGIRSFEWTVCSAPWPAGDWGNYVKAAAVGVAARWGVLRGIDLALDSDLPAAAGLSSSSALVAGVAVALLQAGGIEPAFDSLMEVLPDAEHFVGTRGGGMDHAACLGGRVGCALLVEFRPVRTTPVPLPEQWGFFIAHSLRLAEKSSGVRDVFNLRRNNGASALRKRESGESLTPEEERCLHHVQSETDRVTASLTAIARADLTSFGSILNESHRSLRDSLQVSCPEADVLAEACLRAGAAGARIMGAGFGGYVVGVCEANRLTEVMGRLDRDHFAARRPLLLPGTPHLLAAEAGNGVLA